MTRARSVLLLALAAVLAVSALTPVAAASPGPARAPAGKVTITDGPGLSTVTVRASRRGRTPSGRRGFVGTINATLVPSPSASTLSGLILYFDLDGDRAPELQMRTVGTGSPKLHATNRWTADPRNANLTRQRCVASEPTRTGYRIHYNPDCLGAHRSMRVAAKVISDEGTRFVGRARSWSARVATPSLPWRYCSRKFVSLYPGGIRYEVETTTARALGCTKAKRVIKRARSAFAGTGIERMRVGKFNCTNPNLIGNYITCRLRTNPKRWVEFKKLA